MEEMGRFEAASPANRKSRGFSKNTFGFSMIPEGVRDEIGNLRLAMWVRRLNVGFQALAALLLG